MRFLVTPIGCGIAGYTPAEVAPLFEGCCTKENVTLPAEFWNGIGAPETLERQYDLDRFLIAHIRDYDTALTELRNGRKLCHWIWYIFPQQKGLGHSYNCEYYGLDGVSEAKAYIQHPILGERLRECCRALLRHRGRDIRLIMGNRIDTLKLQTSMNLFNQASPNDIFKEVLNEFFNADVN